MFSFFFRCKLQGTPLFGNPQPQSWYVANITPACRQARLETRNQLFAERPRWPAYTSVLLICCFCCSAESEQCVPDLFTCLPRSYNSCNLNPTLRRGVAHRNRACAKMFARAAEEMADAERKTAAERREAQERAISDAVALLGSNSRRRYARG